MRLPRRKSIVDTMLVVCLVVGVSYLAARLGGTLLVRPEMVWPMWPPNAILVSVLLLVSRKKWPFIISAALATYAIFDVQVGVPARTIFLLILSDLAEILTATLCLSYFFGGLPRLMSFKALAKYLFFAVILAPALCASIGAFSSPETYWNAWRISFLAEALDFLIMAPAILGWFQEARDWAHKWRGYYLEAVALLTSLMLFGYLAFDTIRRGSRPILLYSLVPILLWAALRFGATGVATSMIVVGYLSIRGAVHGVGPFAGPDHIESLISLQLFLLFAAGLFMVLSVLASERRQEELERRKSEEKFSKAFRESPLGISLTSAKDDRYIDVNETFERVTGYLRTEVIGRTPFDIGIWVNPPERQQLAAQLLKEGSLRNIEHQFRTKNGELRDGLSSAELIEIEGEPCILAVTNDVTDRKRAEEHFRLAVESAPNGMVIVDQQGRIVGANNQVEALFGYRRDEVVGQSIDILVPDSLRVAHAGFRKEYHAQPTARFMGVGGDLQARRKDGSHFPVEIGLNPMQTHRGTDILCSIVDITERKKGELALRESEKRFRLVANSAPVMIWMSGPDKLCTFFNQGWLNFTGRALEDELGNGWTSGVHPEDLVGSFKTYSQAFDARVDFEMEYRLRRHDGKYRWITDIGVPRFGPDGRFQGYIGSAIDITDRKQSEEALLEMSGRLITAHEEERARIARELHDDLSQRMALLEIGLEEFEQETPRLSADGRNRLHKVAEIASEISSDIHNLSHKLHPSKLDSLGLVAAVGGFCREFSTQHALHVQFIHHQVDERFPNEVTLCIFRIVQEALRNVVKHSGAADASVEISGYDDRIELRVSDSGVGFDPELFRGTTGLGLISMRERLRLVGGHLTVESEPSRGTRIHAHIPLTAADGYVPSREKSQKAGA